MTILRSALLSIIFTFMAAGAHAMSVTATYTGDNVVQAGLCNDMSCMTGTNFALGPNSNNWKIADAVTVALGAGIHWFMWGVDNLGGASGGNPAGLLAEITWDTMTNASSSAWEVSLDGGGSWAAATEWASNDGSANIWTNNNGGPIAGISGAANWLWSADNFTSETPAFATFRTSITITALPEPGTLSLLVIGFASIAWVRRRKIA